MPEAMLTGGRAQQVARSLHDDTIKDRLFGVRRFQRFTDDWPWVWRPVDVEEFTAELRGDGRPPDCQSTRELAVTGSRKLPQGGATMHGTGAA